MNSEPRYPNMHVEIGARIGELGRQPRAARKFFDRFQDRIPPQGRWRSYGLGLPESILRKVYHANAAWLLA